jgi:hypothetical protein
MGHMSAPEYTFEVSVVRRSVSARPLLSGEAVFGVEGRVLAPHNSWMARRGLEPPGMWQC